MGERAKTLPPLTGEEPVLAEAGIGMGGEMNGFDSFRKIAHHAGWLLFLLFLFAPALTYGKNHAMSEEEKITALIESVRDTPEGTQFIRNGKAHSVADAVSHLHHKYSKAKPSIKTAEDFIKHIASRSSISGEAYLIRYPDGTAITAEAFFTERLRKLTTKNVGWR